MATYRRVKPPRPAKYLNGLPTLETETLRHIEGVGRPTAEQMAKARRYFDRLRQLVREARERYELENNVVIEPEESAGTTTLAQLLSELHQDYTDTP